MLWLLAACSMDGFATGAFTSLSVQFLVSISQIIVWVRVCACMQGVCLVPQSTSCYYGCVWTLKEDKNHSCLSILKHEGTDYSLLA